MEFFLDILETTSLIPNLEFVSLRGLIILSFMAPMFFFQREGCREASGASPRDRTRTAGMRGGARRHSSSAPSLSWFRHCSCRRDIVGSLVEKKSVWYLRLWLRAGVVMTSIKTIAHVPQNLTTSIGLDSMHNLGGLELVGAQITKIIIWI